MEDSRQTKILGRFIAVGQPYARWRKMLDVLESVHHGRMDFTTLGQSFQPRHDNWFVK